MQKGVYIAGCGFLGLLVATLIHAGVELWALKLIFGNPDQFADTIWWHKWDLLHWSVSGVLWTVGLWCGVYTGIKMWPQSQLRGATTDTTAGTE